MLLAAVARTIARPDARKPLKIRAYDHSIPGHPQLVLTRQGFNSVVNRRRQGKAKRAGLSFWLGFGIDPTLSPSPWSVVKVGSIEGETRGNATVSG